MVLKRINSDRELEINDVFSDDDGEVFEANDLFSRMVACALLEVFQTRAKYSFESEIDEGKYMRFSKAWGKASKAKKSPGRGKEYNFPFKAAEGHREVEKQLTKVKQLLKDREDLGEVAMSLLVREYNLFGTFEHVDRALGRSAKNMNTNDCVAEP